MSSQERILKALREARALVAAAERTREPIAIVGIGCRFPGGVDGPDRLWRLLEDGVDATGEQPDDRWDVARYYDPDPDAPGKIYCSRGGFLSRVDEFDADFFGISPREATAMDPQQRLLLEVSWEALEHAGLSADEVKGSRTGIFMGASWRDYDRVVVADRAERLDAYAGMGNTPSIAIGRIAYFLDVHGPVALLDTACSSSLMAVHAAVQSLQTGECDAALAGGVNLILSPLSTIFCCKIRALSRDGRCKTFDAAADGYARAEGCGVVVLKRLSDARRNGDSVYALIRGSAVNHDGRTSGLTVPSSSAQEAVMRQALAAAGVKPSEVAYVEAHGTGTALGDPIEARALHAVYGAERGASPLWLGSIKTNFGHAETAAGIAGLIKAALAVKHGSLVPSLHFEQPNPHIAWSEWPLRVVTASRPWPEGPRIAGVSSFGFSGSNAHVIVQEPPPDDRPAAAAAAGTRVLTLSARTRAGLLASSERFAAALAAAGGDALADISTTSNVGRVKFEHRLAAHGRGARQIAHALAAFARGERCTGVVAGHAPRGRSVRSAWLFADDRCAVPAIDRGLCERAPAFRASVDECIAEGRRYFAEPFAPALWSGLSADAATLDPALARGLRLARQIATARLLSSWNLAPAAVLGIGVGEYAAACVAGALSVADAFALACGPAASERALVPQPVRYRSPDLPVVSAETGAALRDVAGMHLRAADRARPPRAERAFDTLLELGCTVFVAVDGNGLSQLGRIHLDGQEVTWIEAHPQFDALCANFARLFALGAVSDLRGFEGPVHRRVPLPTYPFERRRFWIERGGETPVPADARAGAPPGEPIEVPEVGTVFSYALSRRASPYLADHRVHGEVVVPATALLGLAHSAAQALDTQAGSRAVHDFVLYAPIVLADDCEVRLVVAEARERGERELKLYARRSEPKASWRRHASARIATRAPSEGADERLDLRAVQARCPKRADVDALYAGHARRGLNYGAAFRGIRRLWSGESEALAWVEETGAGAPDQGIAAHTFDAALQTAAATEILADDSLARVPFAIARVLWHRPCPSGLWVHARAQRGTGGDAASVQTHVRLYDAELRLCVEVDGIALRPVDARALTPPGEAASAEWRLHWKPAEPPSTPPRSLRDTHWLVLQDESGVGAALADHLRAAGARVVSIRRGTATRRVSEDEWESDGSSPESLAPALDAMLPSHVDHLVYLWALDAVSPARTDPAGAALEGIARRVCEGALASLRAAAARSPRPSLWFVTAGATAAPGSAQLPFQAPLWGVARTAWREYPKLELSLVDLEADSDVRPQAERLLRELQSGTAPREVAWRGQGRYVPVLEAGAATRNTAQLARPDAASFRLVAGADHMLESLQLRASERTAPRPGEVEIAVQAAGLNFRDVLVALGSYPGSEPPLGGECVGRVCAIGDGVHGLQLGQEVIALASGAFAGFVTTDRRRVVGRPARLGLESSAAVAVAYATAWHALRELARVKAGERVLIHAATGGVGLAAVQIALRAGAQVFATASPHKWPLLRRLGVEHVMSSRTLEFEHRIAAVTGAAGVDVVLNALTGEAIDSSLRCLRPGGRFVELGKRDIWSAERVRAVAPGVDYRVFDLAELAEDAIAALLATVVELLRTGELPPLPTRAFALEQAVAGFQHMARAQHVGKIVLRIDPGLARSASAVRADATYLVTGGFGGLGIEVCRWLLRAGARRIAAVSRRAEPTPAFARLAAEAAEAGATLLALPVDVTDRAALQKLLTAIDRPESPLRGVIHGAGVLEDGVIERLTWTRFWRALAPKVQGAWNLHALTLDRPLDFFCLFSSAASVLGAPGQANYAAANAFLDALAHYRRSLGLPAVSIDWGAFRELGMTQGLDPATRARWNAQGLGAIAQPEVAEWLDRCVARCDEAQVAVIAVDWLCYVAQFPTARVPPMLAELARGTRAAPAGAPDDPPATLAATVRELGGPAGRRQLLAFVTRSIKRVLGRAQTDELDAESPVHELGLDSLMAVELRNLFSRELGLELEAAFAFDYPSAAAQTGELLERLAAADAAARGSAAPERAVAPAVQPDPDLNDLSTDDVVALARSEIAALERELQ